MVANNLVSFYDGGLTFVPFFELKGAPRLKLAAHTMFGFAAKKSHDPRELKYPQSGYARKFVLNDVRAGNGIERWSVAFPRAPFRSRAQVGLAVDVAIHFVQHSKASGSAASKLLSSISRSICGLHNGSGQA